LDLEQTRSQAAALAAKPEWKTVRAVRSGQVFLVDGNSYFNRPGPRLVDSLEILTQIIQPVLFPAPGGGKGWEKL
jgi:iron complex transport system substrate-binding protein